MDEATKSRHSLDDLGIRTAGDADVEALAALINIAFRVELPFIDGDRTNPDGVREYMKKGKFLLAEDSVGLVGCVYVELRGRSWLPGLARRRTTSPGYWPGPQINGCRGTILSRCGLRRR